MVLVKRPFGSTNCETVATRKKLNIGFRYWNIVERKKCYMYTKSLHLVSILLLKEKVVGRTGQYDVDVQDYLYINFDWEIIKNRCKGVKSAYYIWDAQTAEPLS